VRISSQRKKRVTKILKIIKENRFVLETFNDMDVKKETEWQEKMPC
jgi:hypothetical protein